MAFLNRARICAASLALLFSTLAAADEVPVCQLVSAGASVNTTTACPGVIKKGQRYVMQCSTTVHYIAGSSSGLVATNSGATPGLKLKDADSMLDIDLRAGFNVIAIIPASGAATCTLYDSVTK